MTYNLNGAYSQKMKRLTVSSTKKLFYALNLLGADIDIEKSKTLVVHEVVLNNGEKLSCGNRYQCRKLLQTLDDKFDLGIDVGKSSLLGAIYNVYFKQDVFEKLCQKPLAVEVEEVEEVIEDIIEPTLVVVEEDTPEESPEPEQPLVEDINWSLISVPTYGKKNLVELAQRFGVTLNMSMKYKDMIEAFKQEVAEN